MIKQILKAILAVFRLQIVKIQSTANNNVGKVGFLGHKGNKRGRALLSYIIEPYLLQNKADISNVHQHDWLSWEIGRILSSFGYDVDVIDYRDDTFVPQKHYDFFIGARTNFQRLTELLPDQCLKIVHLDTAHWLFNNNAAFNRLLELQQRRGVTLNSIKQIEPNWAIECADYATIHWGNQFNVGTYQYANKKIFQTPLPTCAVYPPPKSKNFSVCNNHFLWLGSRGLVHKGLDLVLEAFSQMPECRLTVCGPIRKNTQDSHNGPLQHDARFEKAFHRELYESPNIHTEGWIDIESEAFQRIVEQCIGVVCISCSEGCSGSAITCMQAGLIPIVNYETNVEVEDFGLTISNYSIEEIKKAVRTVSNMPEEELKTRAQKTWQFCRTHHTREKFTEKYSQAIEQVMSEFNSKKSLQD